MEKENEVTTSTSPSKHKFDRLSQSQFHPTSPSKPFPSTPATRLPLADLIGNVDDSKKYAQDLENSPEDHIVWNSVHSPYTTRTKSTPSAAAQKRARSSSPPSTSRQHAATRSNGNFAHPIAPDTPLTDPARDLWHRYATESNSDTPAGLQATALANLIFSSSPRTGDDQASNLAGLRRWTSCGTEWPSSKAKRRKIHVPSILEEVEDVERQAVGVRQVEIDQQHSKIGGLLDRIQESLSRPRSGPLFEESAQKAPSSSSPLPDRRQDLLHQPTSPSRAPELATLLASKRPHEAVTDRSPLPRDELQSESTSFGSDALDDEAFMEVDNSVVTNQENPTSNDTVVEAPALQHGKTKYDEDTNNENYDDDNADDDEFGGEDLDYEAMERLASVQETDVTSLKKMSTSNRDDEQNEAESYEFGDEDIDDDSFANAEAAATQVAEKRVLIPSNVR